MGKPFTLSHAAVIVRDTFHCKRGSLGEGKGSLGPGGNKNWYTGCDHGQCPVKLHSDGHLWAMGKCSPGCPIFSLVEEGGGGPPPGGTVLGAPPWGGQAGQVGRGPVGLIPPDLLYYGPYDGYMFG